jgi:hypothetical protein
MLISSGADTSVVGISIGLPASDPCRTQAGDPDIAQDQQRGELPGPSRWPDRERSWRQHNTDRSVELENGGLHMKWGKQAGRSIRHEGTTQGDRSTDLAETMTSWMQTPSHVAVEPVCTVC